MLRRILCISLLLMGCVESAPDTTGIHDGGTATDATQSDDAGAVLDLGGSDMSVEVDSGQPTRDAGEGDMGPDDSGTPIVYSSPVPVDDAWNFENSLASATSTATFESDRLGYTDGIAATEALLVGAGQRYRLDRTDLGFPEASGSFTVGAWIRDSAPEGGSILMSRGGFADGGWVLTYSDGSFRCHAIDGQNSASATVALQISSGIWHHVTCRYVRGGDNTVDIKIIVNGRSGQTAMGAFGSTIQTRMGIGTLVTGENSFEGSVDELFMSRSDDLLDGEIVKIWACGLDGRECECDAEAPQDYTSCGRAVDCAVLPPCRE